MPTIPVIERNEELYDELKTENCDIDSADYRQKVLGFHLIKNFVKTDNATLANAMISAFPDFDEYPLFTITKTQLEQALANASCNDYYMEICFNEIMHTICYHIRETTKKYLIAEYRLNLFYSLLIDFPNLTSVEFKPGLCRYNETANPVEKVGVIKANFSNGMASKYYDISIPPNDYLLG